HHQETLTLLVTKLGSADLVLGMSWLELHDPLIRHQARTITFDSDFCASHCLKSATPSISFINAAALKHLVEKENTPVHQIAMTNPDLDLTSLTPRLSASRAETLPVDLKSFIPKEYHDFLPLFNKEKSK